MAEEAVVQEPIRGLPGMQVVTPEGNPFEEKDFNAPPPEEAKPEKEASPAPDNEEIVDEIEYLEKQTGFKSWDEVKALKAEAEAKQKADADAAAQKVAAEATEGALRLGPGGVEHRPGMVMG